MSIPDPDKPTGLQRRRSRRIAPLVSEWVPEGWEPLEPASPVVASGPEGGGEALSAPQSDETGASGLPTAESDLRKLTRPQSRRLRSAFPAVPIEDEPKRSQKPPPPSWRSDQDPALAQLLAWEPPAVVPPDPLAACVVLSPVQPGAQRPAALLAYMAALANDTDRTAYAAADAGSDDLATTLVRIASWLRAVSALSDAS